MNTIELAEENPAARELRNAAYHETAHKAVYEQFGGAGDAVVWRNESENSEEQAWLGQFRPRIDQKRCIGRGRPAELRSPRCHQTGVCMYGMPGLLVEELLCGDSDDDADVIAYNLYSRIALGDASASDLAATDIQDVGEFDLNREVVCDSERLLRGLWGTVKSETERLIAEAMKEVEQAA